MSLQEQIEVLLKRLHPEVIIKLCAIALALLDKEILKQLFNDFKKEGIIK